MVEFECDDALATAAARFAASSSVERVVVCSPDKDLAQCVQGERVVCLDRMRRKTLDERGVIEKFGVRPSSMPDWLALVGEAPTAIPVFRAGARSPRPPCSPRTSASRRFPRMRAIGASPCAAPPRSPQACAAHRTEAVLFRQLATLRTDAPLAESLEELRWRGPDVAALAALADLWGDDALVERARRLAGR